MPDEPDVYGTWLSRYSESQSPAEALTNVKKEVEDLFKEGVPIEVRMAALESFIVDWSDFILTMFFIDEVHKLIPREQLVDNALAAAEFLRLAALAEAIKMDRLANEGNEK